MGGVQNAELDVGFIRFDHHVFMAGIVYWHAFDKAISVYYFLFPRPGFIAVFIIFPLDTYHFFVLFWCRMVYAQSNFREKIWANIEKAQK